MGKLNEVLNSKLVPTDALIFYKSSICNGGSYVEHRKIREGKMESGSPLQVSALAKMLKAVDKYAHDTTTMSSLHGLIPKNLLYASSNLDTYKLVWYRKQEKRMLYFVDGLEIPNGEMWVPGLVYATNGKGLRVFAYKGTRPKEILYRAPFFNVDEKVCLGNAKVEKPKDMTYQNWMDYWEKMFWQSEFVHLLGSNPIKGNLATLTKDLIATGKKFPLEQLIKAHATLKRLYEYE